MFSAEKDEEVGGRRLICHRGKFQEKERMGNFDC